MADPSGRPIIWCIAGEGNILAHILWVGEKLALCSAHICCHSKTNAASASERDNMLQATVQTLCKRGYRQTARVSGRAPLTLLSQRSSQSGTGKVPAASCLAWSTAAHK